MNKKWINVSLNTIIAAAATINMSCADVNQEKYVKKFKNKMKEYPTYASGEPCGERPKKLS